MIPRRPSTEGRSASMPVEEMSAQANREMVDWRGHHLLRNVPLRLLLQSARVRATLIIPRRPSPLSTPVEEASAQADWELVDGRGRGYVVHVLPSPRLQPARVRVALAPRRPSTEKSLDAHRGSVRAGPSAGGRRARSEICRACSATPPPSTRTSAGAASRRTSTRRSGAPAARRHRAA